MKMQMIKKKAVKKKAKEKRNTQQEKNHEVENVMFFHAFNVQQSISPQKKHCLIFYPNCLLHVKFIIFSHFMQKFSDAKFSAAVILPSFKMEPQTIHYGEHALRKHHCNINPFKITTQVPYILQSPAATPDIPKPISLCTYICNNISSGFLHLNKLESQTPILLTWRIW